MYPMSSSALEKSFYWAIRVLAYASPFTLLIVADSMFFPFVSGKNFAFRIVVEIMAAAWVGLLIINFRKYWPKWGLLAAAFAVFVALTFIFAVFGVNFSMSFWSNYERMDGVITQLHLLGLFLVLIGTFRTKREWFSIFAVSIFVSAIIALYGFLEYFGIITYEQNLHSRIISTLGNPLYVAAYLSFHIFLIFYLLGEIKNIWLKWLLGTILFFEFIILFLTGSRGAFVGMVLGIGLILLYYTFLTAGRKKKIIFVSIILILATLPVFLNIFQNTEFIRSNGTLSRFSDISLKAGESRFIIWDIAFDAFRERPILGWGSENFIVPFGKYYDPRAFNLEPWYDRTHNMFFEWLVAGGVVGFLAYLFLIGSIFWTIIKGVMSASFTKKQMFIFFAMFVSYLVQLLFVFDTLATYLMFTLFAAFFYAASSYPQEWPKKNYLFSALKFNHSGETRYYKISASRLSTLFAVLVLFFIIMTFVNIRPLMANRSLMRALALFRARNFDEARENFKKAFKLSKGTVGAVEVAEHLAFSAYNLFDSPDVLHSTEGGGIYRLARDEMEKLAANPDDKNPNIKHNIILAQLYHQKALTDQDVSALQNAFENYEKVVLDSAPNYVSVHAVYATLLAQTGNLDGAILLTEKASVILESAKKYDARTFYSVPLYYTALKKYDNAYARLSEIAERYNDHLSNGVLDKEMMRDIVMTTRAHGEEALPFLKQLHNLDKTLTAPALMIAQVYVSLDNKKEARFYAEEAFRRDPSLQSQVAQFIGLLGEE